MNIRERLLAISLIDKGRNNLPYVAEIGITIELKTTINKAEKSNW